MKTKKYLTLNMAFEMTWVAMPTWFLELDSSFFSSGSGIASDDDVIHSNKKKPAKKKKKN